LNRISTAFNKFLNLLNRKRFVNRIFQSSLKLLKGYIRRDQHFEFQSKPIEDPQ
jgi:hypothetical protein